MATTQSMPRVVRRGRAEARPARLGALRLLLPLWRLAETVFGHAGSLGLLFGRVVRVTAHGRVPLREVVAQAYTMGVESLPLVVVTSTLSGIVTSQQGGYQLGSAMPLYILGTVVTNSIVLELAPIMTAIALIGRVGARITTELGAMKVSEQIDAVYALGRDPIALLAAPRILACTLVMPVLVAIADAVGPLAGMVATRTGQHLGFESFLYGARLFWQSWLFVYSLLKAVTFGFMIPLISVHMGLLSTGGAEGIGRKTTASVVFMLIAVLLVDALFPPLFLTR